MVNGANELLPLPLPAMEEHYDNQDSLTCPGKQGLSAAGFWQADIASPCSV
jgi:hypothetical protein